MWPATRAAVETLVAPLAVGRDERDVAGLLADLQQKLHLLGRTGPMIYTLSGLNIALWDIAAKRAGLPCDRRSDGKIQQSARLKAFHRHNRMIFGGISFFPKNRRLKNPRVSQSE